MLTFFALGGLAIPSVKSLTLRIGTPVALWMFSIDIPPFRSLTTVSSAGIESVLRAVMVLSSIVLLFVN